MRRMTSVFLAGLLAGVTGVASAQLTLPVTDNFATAGSPDQSWVDYDLATDVSADVVAFSPTAPSGDGITMQIDDGSGWGAIYLAADDGSLADVKVTAMIYCTSIASPWSRYGIVVRGQTASTNLYRPIGYYLMLDSDDTDYLRIVQYDDSGNWEDEFYTSPDGQADYTLDAWHEFTLVANGDSVAGFLDGNPVGTGVYDDSDDPIGAGYIAIVNYMSGSGGASTYVDRVTVEASTPGDLTGGSPVNNWELYGY